VNLSGGSLTTSSDLRVGGINSAGTGTFTQTGGAVSVAANLNVAWGVGSVGTYNLGPGGTLTVGTGLLPGTRVAAIGNLGGTATLNMTGGTFSATSLIQFARTGGTATLNLQGGDILAGGDFWLGSGSSVATEKSTVTATQSGGTITTGTLTVPNSTTAGFFYVGRGMDNVVNYTLTNGNITTYTDLVIGGGNGNQGGTGTLTQEGGIVTVGSLASGQGNINIGQGTSATGTYNLKGGDLVLNRNTGTLVIAVGNGAGGTGTLNQSGGRIIAPTYTLDVARNSSTGTYNLSGGSVRVAALTPRTGFNWTGGTLSADTIGGTITNGGGVLAPGGAGTTGTTTFGTNFSYTQNGGGTLGIDVLSNGDHDSVVLGAAGSSTGNATLAGTTAVTLGGGYTPGFGASFGVLNADTITDTTTLSAPALPAGLQWEKRVTVDTPGASQTLVLTVDRVGASARSSGGQWFESAAWSGATPNAVDASARISGAGGITLDAPATVGYLTMDTADGYSLTGSGLTIDTSGGAQGGILVYTGTNQRIDSAVQVNDSAVVGVAAPNAKLTIGGTLSGTGVTLRKTGAGTLALTGANTFDGVIAVDNGTLQVGSDANFGAATTTLQFAGGRLQPTAALTTARTVALQGKGATLDTVNGDITLNGVVSGAGGLTTTGTKIVTLGAANTYTGPTSVTQGTLRQTVANAVPAASAVTVVTGATFDMGGQAAAVGSLAGGGGVTVSAPLSVGADNSSTTFAGALTGTGALTKTGTGTLTLSGNNGTSLTGNVTVSGGTLQVSGANSLPNNAAGKTLTNNANVTLAVANTVSATIAGTGSVTLFSGNTTLAADNSYSGGTTIVNGTAIVSSDARLGQAGTGIAFTGNGQIQAAGSFTIDRPITVAKVSEAIVNTNANNVVLNKPISGEGGFRKQATGGTLTLNAASTYQGITSLSTGGGTLQMGVDNALPQATYMNWGSNVTLDLNGHDLAVGTMTGGASATTPAIVSLGSRALTVGNDNSEATFGGNITGTGGRLVKAGTGTQGVSGNNTYTGGTTISAGALQVNSATALPVAGGVTNNGLLIFNVADPGVSYAGNIGGSGAVLVQSGTAALTGTNTYSGGTIVSGGTLNWGADGQLGSATGRIVMTGGTLKPTAAITSARPLTIGVPNAPGGSGTIDTTGGSLTFTGSVAGGGSLTKAGAGTLTLNGLPSGALTVNAGTVAIAAGNATRKVSAVTLATDASLDLTTNDLIVDYATASPYAALLASAKGAYNTGLRDKAGLLSSTAAAAGVDGVTTLAIVDNTAGAYTTFDGVGVDNTAILIKYTYFGDANLDGVVNEADVALFTIGGTTWRQGDFNYDGTVNEDDRMLLTLGGAKQGAPINPSVPEPAGIATLAIVGAWAAGRRRQRRQG
jgi:autotransporter-associated beta strand protein